MVKMVRRGWLRLAGLGTVTACALLYIYYYSSAPTAPQGTQILLKDDFGGSNSKRVVGLPDVRAARENEIHLDVGGGASTPSNQCPNIPSPKTDVNTVTQFPKFEFQPAWMRGKEFWDTNFEKRYLNRRSKWKKLPLKVILMPHSHNDPGWLRTYEEYYFHQTSKILHNMVEKLRQHTNMTFIWSEVAYLSLWYERAHPTLRQHLRELVASGRLEVATGGWVMTDEANVHLYAMLDQLIEGHTWLDNTLGVRAQHGWAIDPFGHGAALPYLLNESGLKGTVIQRIHYAWKQWLAEQQLGDFKWRQVWDASGDTDLLTHNRPYDIYSIKHSCGPHPQICLGYDFRKIPGEYTEFSIKSVNIDEHNVKAKAELLLEQYGRTGSLYPHNVVLVPLGDDFRYDHAAEWDQQYTNYHKLMDQINSNPSYHATIQWGTLKDYFNEIKSRMKQFPTLQGDFFVYSDIFSEGRPAYWSGYYTTRPYWKSLDRQLEASLRSAEILYTWALTHSTQKSYTRVTQLLEKDYEKLVRARRNLGLFQHHDAITGTSKAYVMHDYAIKLHEGLHDTISIAGHAAQALLLTPADLSAVEKETTPLEHLQPDFERATYEKLPRKLPISVNESPRLIVLFNSLAQRRHEMMKVLVASINIRLTDEHGHNVPFQINPVWNDTGSGMAIMTNQYELFFIADLPPLSLVTFSLYRTADPVSAQHRATVYSNYYAPVSKTDNAPPFETRDVLTGDIQLESDKLKLLFDGSSGMLRSVTDKETGRVSQTTLKYASYPSAQFKSGAYLFKPDPNAREPEEDVLIDTKPRIFIHSGPIASELTVMFGQVLMHTTRIFHTNHEPLTSALYMENSFNLGGRYNSTETPGFPPQYRETELFMRFMTDIDNGAEPTFYTDQSGLNMQRRERVERIGIQGNYFPITCATYLEDNKGRSGRRRLTLLTDHSAGAASWQQGWIEVMVERRTFYDDARGMGEGVTDQKRTIGRYWVVLEQIQGTEEVPRLSLAAHHLSNGLNYPPMLMVLEGLPSTSLEASAHLINRPLPCPLHLITLRTLPEKQYPGMLPSKQALLVLQHQAPSCITTTKVGSCNGMSDAPEPDTRFTIDIAKLELSNLSAGPDRTPLKDISQLHIPQHRLRAIVISFPNNSSKPV